MPIKYVALKNINELYIILFQKLASELKVDKVESFGVKLKKKYYYMSNIDGYMLRSLKYVHFINLYVV